MQNPFGIAVGLRAPLKDQVAGSLKRYAIKARRHGPVARIGSVLPIDDFGHAALGFMHLFLIDNAVLQPVRDVLA
jgi:hypothetical protein